MKFDCPNGTTLEIDPTAGVTVRVFPSGTMEIQGPKKAGGGKLAVSVMLSMVAAGAIGFLASDVIRDASNVEAERLARYDNTTAPRIRGAEPPAWVGSPETAEAIPQYLPPRSRPAPPSSAPVVITPSDVERLYQQTNPARAPAQSPSNAPQSPFGLDAP